MPLYSDLHSLRYSVYIYYIYIPSEMYTLYHLGFTDPGTATPRQAVAQGSTYYAYMYLLRNSRLPDLLQNFALIENMHIESARGASLSFDQGTIQFP